MANFDKLQEGQARLSPEQRRENARLAGIASGEARQRRKLMRETAAGILKAPVAIPEIAAALEAAGACDGDEIRIVGRSFEYDSSRQREDIYSGLDI